MKLIFAAALGPALALAAPCTTCDPVKDFPVDLSDWQYKGLTQWKDEKDVASCAQKCCDVGPACVIWQFSKADGCWAGAKSTRPYPDPTHAYQSRGRNMAPPAPTPAPTPVPSPKGPFAVDDTAGKLGLRWEGVGAISGGGATSKLLMDYEPAVASDILDFLFTPGFGLSLQMLKVEIGGDTDATEGAEPSHMHAAGDANYERGYEWWLMKEAKKRNPDLKLYGLPWGWAGWLDPSATADKEAKNAFADPATTANYTLSWLRGAKQVHGLDIDYIGEWNERNAPAPYNTALRQMVASDPLLSGTTCLDRLPHYPGTTDAMDSKGCSQYAWNTTGGSRWVDEEGSIYDGRSARCLARCVNRNYVSGCHTATFQWHLVSSFYDYLPWSRCGVAVANTPWSGAYEITSPLWALAHTSQFAPVGWRYAAHGSGVTTLEKGGSMVTRLSPDGADFSVVLEKMDSKNSACARGSNPPSTPEDEEVVLVLGGSFKKAAAAAGGALQVWYSNLTSANDEGTNPPDSQLFQKLAPITVGADGTVKLTVKVQELYTLTTLTTGGKGAHTVPAAADFALPYTQSFDGESIPAPPALWYDQMGAWEVAADPSELPDNGNGNNNQVMRQVVPVWPQCWGYSCTGPTTYFGPSSFRAGTALSVDVRLEDQGNWTFGVQAGSKTNGGVTLDTDGSWSVEVAGKKLGSGGAGAVSFSANKWHTVQFHVGASYFAATLDGKVLVNATAGAKDTPGVMNDWRVMVSMGRYIFAAMDNFKMAAL